MNGVVLRALLCAYPRAWRERYGDELAALIAQMGDEQRLTWRIGANIILAGGRERLRALGLVGDRLTPEDRAKDGCLLVLWAWMLFVVGGVIVQKSSEHWQSAIPASHQGLPAVAFHTVVAAAALGGVLVVAGIALTLSSVRAFVRAGGWPIVRRAVSRAAALTVPTVAGGAGLILWAHRLTTAQRNGLDHRYLAGFAVVALMMLASLVAWTMAAAAIARQIGFTRRLLRVEATLAAAVTATMTVMTIATVAWWSAVAHAAPWFLAGTPPGSSGSVLPPDLATAAALMLIATMLGVVGTRRLFRNVRVQRIPT
jgi:hypothetical protein